MDEQIVFRVPTGLKLEIERRASLEQRTTANWLRKTLNDHLKADKKEG